jgi:hypothetical protein
MYVLAASLMLAAAPAAHAFQNEPTGFRGISWGTPLSSVPGMTPVASDGSAGFYQRDGDAMMIGAAHLKDINYRFYRRQFAGVLLRTPESSADEDAIIAAFSAQFGQGNRPNQFMKQYLWNGSVATVFLDCNVITHACTGAMLSNELKKLEDADKAAVARKGAKDF